MRKPLLLLLVLALLCPVPASAAERPRYLALVFDGCPENPAALLAGLEAREVRATFFLSQGEASRAGRLAAHGHEQGIRMDAGPELSRREIGAALKHLEAQLGTGVRFLYSPGACSDGLRQVATARGFSFLAPSGRLRPFEKPEDGDILLVEQLPLISLLEMVDDLQREGFHLLTLSELARLRGKRLRPGVVYRGFPPEEGFDRPAIRRYNTSG